jgi:hypothetical protein
MRSDQPTHQYTHVCVVICYLSKHAAKSLRRSILTPIFTFSFLHRQYTHTSIHLSTAFLTSNFDHRTKTLLPARHLSLRLTTSTCHSLSAPPAASALVLLLSVRNTLRRRLRACVYTSHLRMHLCWVYVLPRPMI